VPRAPWHYEARARELVAAVSGGRFAATVFRARFGDDLLLDALAGDGVQGLAMLLALEHAVAWAIPAADPMIGDWQWRWGCLHAEEPGASLDLIRRVAYCGECEDEMVERLGPVFDEPPDDDGLDRCDLCGDLAGVAWFRTPLGARFVVGRACPACDAYGRLT
jgi:hypothetical protein